MSDGTPAQQIADLVSAPLEALLVALGSGIGRSQAELDRHSIDTQRLIDEDPVLSQYGLQATWYQIPRTELELKIAVAMERAQATGPALPATPALPSGAFLPRLFAQPVNARYTQQFHYDINAASTVTLTIAAVPPPGPAAAGTPTQTQEAVLEVAGPKLLVDAQGAPQGRVTVNFNPGERAWFVVQTQEQDGQTTLLTLLKILDDPGLEIVKQTGGR
jgi:hypothetical protein